MPPCSFHEILSRPKISQDLNFEGSRLQGFGPHPAPEEAKVMVVNMTRLGLGTCNAEAAGYERMERS